MASVHYEVTARVREDLVTSFVAFMREKHIRDVLQTGAFIGAVFEELTPTTFRVRFEAATAAQLEGYLTHHAPRLRNDAAAHFPDGIEFSRETWTLLARYGAARQD